LDGLASAGTLAGAIDLPLVWPILSAWWRIPVVGVAPEDDEFEFLLSIAPAGAIRGKGLFADEPPPAIAGVDLVQIDFGREFVHRTGPGSSIGLPGGVAVTLWYAVGPAWAKVPEQTDEWIDLGLSTPHIDDHSHGGRLSGYMERLERSAAFQTAWRERARALRLAFDDRDDVLVVGRGSP